jgi:putative NIF3 family GTP cyclohydrolase 1 type 2
MQATSPLTIHDAIEIVVTATAVAPLADTVDTVKTGDPNRPLAGIVTTFLATAEVIARANQLGANLIITHEPTFYNHRDDTTWLESDATYQAKRRLIDDHGIVIWRFHDSWHRTRPDGILRGLLERLGWDHEGEIVYPAVATIAPLALAELAGLVKARLGVPSVRVSGPPDLICQRTGLLAGAPGGRMQIEALGRADVDAVICGEINEWETCEYARDATFFGRPKGLIVVGHQPSEEDGMAYLATWLRSLLPAVAITHVPAGDPLRPV